MIWRTIFWLSFISFVMRENGDSFWPPSQIQRKQDSWQDNVYFSMSAGPPPTPPPPPAPHVLSSKQYLEGRMGRACKGCERKKSVSGEGWGRKWSGEQFSDFTLLVSFDFLWPLLKTKQNKIYDKTKCSLKCQPVLPACGRGGVRSLSPAPSTGYGGGERLAFLYWLLISRLQYYWNYWNRFAKYRICECFANQLFADAEVRDK